MKKIAFGIACGLSAVFVFLMMLSLYGRSVRKTETDTMLSQAIDTTLSGMMNEHGETTREDDGLIADFLKTLLVQKNSDSDVTVSILDADAKFGILSVEVTEKYRHPNGNEGSVSEMRTVIYDKAKEDAAEQRQVQFYVADTLYKEYGVKEGSVCVVPLAPKMEGKEFVSWRFVSGGTGEAEQIVMSGENGSKTVLGQDGLAYRVLTDTKLVAVFR